MSKFQFTTTPYLQGPQGFVWEDSQTARHSDLMLVRGARPHIYPWCVAQPAPRGEHWAPVTLHGSRGEAMKAAGESGAIFQGAFSKPRDGLVVARGRIFAHV